MAILVPVPAGAEPAPPAPAYVALGDSYSAGEGLRPYQPGTDEPQNRCHRGTGGYPDLVARSPFGQRFGLRWVACGGARTNHVRADEQFPGDQPGGQVSALAGRPDGGAADVVSITIGGNDARFSEVLRACIVGLLPCYLTHFDETVHIERTVRPLLAATYAALRAAAPSAPIFAMTYPQIFRADRECLGDAGIGPLEKRWIRDRTAQLNQVVVEEAARAGLVPVEVGDAFAGHEICSAEAWAFGLGRTSGRFHPNALGHQALATALLEAMAGNVGAPSTPPVPSLVGGN